MFEKISIAQIRYLGCEKFSSSVTVFTSIYSFKDLLILNTLSKVCYIQTRRVSATSRGRWEARKGLRGRFVRWFSDVVSG